jgi:predicted deacylase
MPNPRNKPLLAAACGLSFIITACAQNPVLLVSEPTALQETSPPPQPTANEDPTLTPAPPSTPRPDPSPTVFASGPEIIGYTVAGRSLTMYRYGGGPSRRLIVAGIHGGYEWNTIALAHQLMSHLTVHPEIIPPNVSLYLLPALNKDGEARSSSYEGRANDNGVDLNRNWPSLWQENWPKAGCWSYRPIHGGSAPASEPEVAALMEFILGNDIEAIISYHSAALGIFPGGQPPFPDSVDLAETVAEVVPYPYPPVDAGCLYTGQFTDWAADVGIPALVVELTNHRDTDLEINLRVLEAFLNWDPDDEPN